MKNNKLPEEIERFPVIFRIQHIILFTTFLLLAFTGIALKYPEVEHARWWIRIWGGPKTAGTIHRYAGITMLLDFVWHVSYLTYLLAKGKMKLHPNTTIIPMPKDVFDLFQNILYFVGISKTKPKFGKYSYIQKFDYWAVFWGMAIIGFSGLVLAFPTEMAHIFPNFTLNWVWELMRVLHSDEALLAIVFILFWHFYNEHLKVGKFPMSWTWLTGKLSLKDLKHEHPLEYELLFPEKKKVKSKE